MNNDNSPSAPRHPVCAHEADFSILNSAVIEIKDTLKELKDCVTANAVLEEQATQARKRITEIDARLRTVELDAARSKGTSAWMERIVWAVVALGLSALLVVKG